MLLALTIVTAVLLGGGGVTGRALLGGPRGLPDAVVSVRSGLPARGKYQAPRAPAVLQVRACRFLPQVTALMVGQPLEIRNVDGTPHRIVGRGRRNPGFDVVVPGGAATRRYLGTAEIPVRLRCDGGEDTTATVAVLAHPFFAVTAPDGTFLLRGLPPGAYTLEAWHGRYGVRTARVTVTGEGTVTQDFRFAPP